MDEDDMSTEGTHHAPDVAQLKGLLIKELGPKSVFVIDKQVHPIAFKESSFRFVVDCSLDRLKSILDKHLITREPSRLADEGGYVSVVGPKRKSVVMIDTLPSITPYDINMQIFDALQGGWAVQLFYAIRDSGLMAHILPEIQDTVACEGGPYHGESVFDHMMGSLKAAKEYPYNLQLAVLLHDIGKPGTVQTKRDDAGKVQTSFHQHEVIGATIAYKLLKRLLFTDETIRYVVKMIRHHMFRFEDDSSDKAICKWLFKVGKNEWEDLFLLRQADRKGNKANKDKPAITKKMKDLEEKIIALIGSGIAIFKEDLNITEEEIRNNVHIESSVEEVFLNLLGIVNGDPTRNEHEWLLAYVRRVYG
jgi:putative nucleotidyltransferase with HDIG domain